MGAPPRTKQTLICSMACFSKAYDPSCWDGWGRSAMTYCCSGSHEECWDSHHDAARCCRPTTEDIKDVPLPELSLGTFELRSLSLLRTCWPTELPARSYERYCALHPGEQYDGLGLTSRDNFETCCLPVISQGLQLCSTSAGKWCT